MSVIAWIFIGLLAGWLATQVLGGRVGLLRNLAVGLVGAVVGGFLFEKLRVEVVPDFWGNLITATIGAIVFLRSGGQSEGPDSLARRRPQP
jgi:uncharacterized membrane protein YeaQ/YmgE (transglycosylase-associated protein family)